MSDLCQTFIEFALRANVLQFGDFTLKSGRQSPYFFNAGQFNSGEALLQLGQFYAQRLMHAKTPFDILFGPAYKGIPLVSATAISLARDFNLDKPYAFNRKEVKDHGEGGQIVGHALTGKVMVVDDVITAGTALRESITMINAQGASLAGVLIAFDRQEKNPQGISTIQAIEDEYNVPVLSIINLNDLIQYLGTIKQDNSLAEKISAYREAYGVD